MSALRVNTVRHLTVLFCLLLGLTLILFVLALMPAVAHTSAGLDLTVCPAGPPECDYEEIQTAVQAAGDGDVIKVAGGIYTGVAEIEGISQLVYITKSLTIRGGYSPPFTNPPDPGANPTTLDAQRQGRVVFISNGITVTLEGLDLTGGSGDREPGCYDWDCPNDGGALYVREASLTINSCDFFSNTAEADYEGNGGAIYADDAAVAIQDSHFSHNAADYGGGALYLSSDDETRIISSTFAANESHGFGGGIFVSNGQADIKDSLFVGNRAYYGGGLDICQGRLSLEDNVFRNNSASHGGGLRLCVAEATLEGNEIVGNDGSFGGGLGLEYFSAVTLTNNIIADNQATVQGGGLFVQGGSTGLLLHNTFAANTGPGGDAIHVGGVLTATNTIIAGHLVGVMSQGDASLESTLWGAGYWANDYDTAGPNPVLTGTLNLWADPLFTDPALDDYHVGPGSPAIDAGLNAGVTSDIDGDSRPLGAGFDIGADEAHYAGLYLSTSGRPKQGARDQMVQHQIRLTNLTGAIDTFDLVLGDHTWDSMLQANAIGPIADGDSAVFTLDVAVPIAAAWFASESAVISATSTANPGIYSDAVTVTTEAYAPPSVSVTPEMLSSAQATGLSETLTLSVDNGNGLTGTFDILVVPPFGEPEARSFIIVGGYCTWDVYDDLSQDPGLAAYSFDYVSDNDDWYFDLVKDYDGLIVACGELSAGEAATLRQFYESGKPVFLTDGNVAGYAPSIQSDIYAVFGVNNAAYEPVVATTLNQEHPIARGVSVFDTGIGDIGTFQEDGAVWVARGEVGQNYLLAYEGLARAVIFGADLYQRGWDADGDQLLRNAIHWVAGSLFIDDWLTVDPLSGSVASDGRQDVEVTFDASGLSAGRYSARFDMATNDPAHPLFAIPVQMTVLPAAGMGWVEGHVTVAGVGHALEATISASGLPFSATSDAETGAYWIWLPAGAHTLQATSQGYEAQSVQVNVAANQGHQLDVQLASPGAKSLNLISQSGGGIWRLAREGDYVYASESGRLIILDITNPAAPIRVGQTEPFGAGYIAVLDDTAYVSSLSGLHIFDVSDPADPVEISQFGPLGNVSEIVVAGSTVYVAESRVRDDDGLSGVSGLRLIDVSDPHAPEQLRFLETNGAANDVAISGDLALLADGYGLRVFYVGVPAVAYETRFIELSWNNDDDDCAQTVAVADDYAYMVGYDDACDMGGLYTIRLSDWEMAGPFPYTRPSNELVARGNYLYEAVEDGLRIVDVSDWMNPSEDSYLELPAGAHDLALATEYAFVAGGQAGMHVIEVTNPDAPSAAGVFRSLAASKVAARGDYAYLASESGLQIVDISDPVAPALHGSMVTPGSAWGLDLAGDFVYMARGYEGLRIVNVADPAAPTESGYYDDAWVRDVAMFGEIAYLIDPWSGLVIVDVSDPAEPVEHGSYSFGDDLVSLALAGDYAFVTGYMLHVIDATDPVSPSEVISVSLPGLGRAIALSGNHAYVVVGEDSEPFGGLYIVDIADPAAPQIVGFYRAWGESFQDVAVAGDYAYLSHPDDGLHIVYVADPTAPSLAAYHDCKASSAALANDLVYLACENLSILRLVQPSGLGVYLPLLIKS